MQPSKPTEKPYLLLGELAQDSPLQGLSTDAAVAEDPRSIQELTTAYITSLYYSALSNLFTQSILPATLTEVNDEKPRLKIALNRSYTDFTTAAGWLAKNGGEFIATSPAKRYYDEVFGMDKDSIKDISGVYSQNI